MRNFLTAMGLSIFMVGAAQAQADTPVAVSPAAVAPVASAPASGAAVTEAKLVCRRETPIGSTIPRRVCEREQDNAAQAAQTQNDLANAAQRSRQITVHSAGG